MKSTQEIVPSLWFDKECEEAITFYIAAFNGSPHEGLRPALTATV